MNKVLLSLLALFCIVFSGFAQEDEKPLNLIYQSSMLGIGSTSIYDTYLSPLKYSGTQVGLFHEEMKMTGLMNGNVSAQQLFNLDFSWSKNPEETASDYSGFMEYSYGLYYKFKMGSNFQIFAGSQADGMIGFIYNNRNGNNPATGKAHLNLNLSAIAAYEFNIKSQPFRLRYQINTPFIGILFSPQFGQSYYEISMGDDSDLVHFASFHNQLSMRNILSLEVPLNSLTFRLVYMNTAYETDVNHIQTRVHSNSFFIGFSKDFFNVSGKKQVSKNFKRVFE